EKGPAILKSVEVRRALATSIPRKKILEDLRAPTELKVHTPLSSLYPPGTWVPLDRDPRLDLFDEAFAGAALGKLPGGTTLTAKIPAADPALPAAFDTWA